MPHTDAGEYSKGHSEEGSAGLGAEDLSGPSPAWIQCGKRAPEGLQRKMILGFWTYLNANVLGSQAGPAGTVVGRGRGSWPGSPTGNRDSVASGSSASLSSGSQPCWPT